MTSPRKKDEDRIWRDSGRVRQVEAMTQVDEFHQKFSGELARVYPYLGMAASLVLRRCLICIAVTGSRWAR